MLKRFNRVNNAVSWRGNAYVEQKSIVVEDLSPLAMYALRKADLVPRQAARSQRHDDDKDDVDDDDEAASDKDHNKDAEQVLLTDDDIQVMIYLLDDANLK